MLALKKERANYQREFKPTVAPETTVKQLKQPLNPVIKTGIVVIVVVALGLGLVYRQTIITTRNREISNLRNSYSQLQDENNHLKIQVARLSSLARIEKIAVEELNLRSPRPNQIVVVNNSEASGN